MAYATDSYAVWSVEPVVGLGCDVSADSSCVVSWCGGGGSCWDLCVAADCCVADCAGCACEAGAGTGSDVISGDVDCSSCASEGEADELETVCYVPSE